MWTTEQGPHLVLNDVNTTEREKAHTWWDRNNRNWNFPFLADHEDEVLAEDTIKLRQMECETNNRFLSLVKVLLPLSPQTLSTLLPPEHVGVKLPGDLLEVFSCSPVTKTAYYQTSRAFAKYLWSTKCTSGFTKSISLQFFIT